MKIFDIGVLAERSGVPPSTLRYYEEVGLIESIGRRGLRRQFGSEALTQLALISLGQVAGFSLDEIKGMFGKDGVPDVPRAAIHARAEALEPFTTAGAIAAATPAEVADRTTVISVTVLDDTQAPCSLITRHNGRSHR